MGGGGVQTGVVRVPTVLDARSAVSSSVESAVSEQFGWLLEQGAAVTGASPEAIGTALVVLATYYLVGGTLLAAWPGFSRTVTETIVRRPVRALLSGILVLVGVSALAIAAFAVLWISGPFLVFALVWLPIAVLAVVYVSVALAGTLLSLAGIENRFVALVFSGLAPLALALAPREAAIDLLFVGVLALGGGAVAWSAWSRRGGAAS